MGGITRSKVIDAIVNERQESSGAEKLVYFYCNRAEEARRDPEMIMSALIHQLAQADDRKILKPVVDIYKDREQNGQISARLTLEESQELLVKIADIYPRTTICLDALDEVDHEIRIRLLKSLKHVIEKSKNLVKIFATSRNDMDIFLQFKEFPMIDLEPDDNISDINEFITWRMKNVIRDRELLSGKVSDRLETEIRKALCERSKGM